MPPLPPKFFPISWEEIHRDAKALAWRLAELGAWKGVVDITRGGLIPTAIIAQELDLRVIETVGIKGYNADNASPEIAEEAVVLKKPCDVGDGAGWLVVDDLVDTGRTLEVLRKSVLMPFPTMSVADRLLTRATQPAPDPAGLIAYSVPGPAPGQFARFLRVFHRTPAEGGVNLAHSA